PACNPSRSAIFTGRAPNSSGLYDNRQQMREIMPDAVLLPQYFRNHGYSAKGSGKMLHYFIDAHSWDVYFPEAKSENPLPWTYYPKSRPVHLPKGGPWQYVETDWAPLDVTDKEFGGDWSVSNWIGDQLRSESEKSFFLACGLYRPHEPWFVPKKYFEPFPLDSIKLPPGYKKDDLEDVPEAGVRGARNRYFPHILEHDQWKQGIQGYLASIHFADAMLGRVLDALESGPHADNTIVVLWSDHGWQLGEKEHWQKYTGWRAVTRVPLIVRIPEGVSTKVAGGTKSGTQCDAPVNLLSLYPTLLELCGLDPNPVCDGPSLVPLLQNPDQTKWNHPSITFLSKPGSYSISERRYRYIHYSDGSEELYDVKSDPYEWKNLAPDSTSASTLELMRQKAPAQFQVKQEASVGSLNPLMWHPAGSEKAPASKPEGGSFPVFFINQQKTSVELFWMDTEGGQKSYGLIEPGEQKRQQTRPGAVWMIQDPVKNQSLGHFEIGDRSTRAIVPASDSP
ncbi:MAG: sulfatase-like hydrolase/transferase, partial [Verrucomicrobia bacterium]|nr:sulfatase-like hydrolase/transferase [Verrucomicrobiota bacterium]